MQTTGAKPRHLLLHLRDVRLIDMLDGAPLFPAPQPQPARATHDFLVVNPYPDFAPETRIPRNRIV